MKKYAKMLENGQWWVIRHRESHWKHHEDFWVKIALAEDESEADRIVRALNGPDTEAESEGEG